MDGPAHLHNSHLINILLSDENEFVSNYLQLNPVLVPNWTGHALMAFMLLFLPAVSVEKILASMLAIALPYSFRTLMKKGANKSGIAMSYFIFPFTYSLTFLLGFYNYTIGVILLFLGIKFWLNNRKNIADWQKCIALACISLLLYFSHIIPFLVFYLFVALHETVYLYYKKSSVKALFKKVLVLLLASTASFVFLYSFMQFRSSVEKEYLFLDFSTLLDWMVDLRALIVFNTAEEAPFTSIIFYAILALSIGLAVKILYKKAKLTVPKTENIFPKRAAYFLAFLAFFAMFFLLPDNDGVGGEIIPRIQWLMFAFLLLFLSNFEFPNSLLFPVLTLVFFAHFQLNSYYYETQENRGKFALKVLEMEKSIPPKTLVHVVNLGGNWTYSHFSNLLGINEEVVLLKNYEADRDYFPLVWSKQMPILKLGSKEIAEVYGKIPWHADKANGSKVVEYIFVQGNVEQLNDSNLSNIIKKHYQLQMEQEDLQLYGLK